MNQYNLIKGNHIFRIPLNDSFIFDNSFLKCPLFGIGHAQQEYNNDVLGNFYDIFSLYRQSWRQIVMVAFVLNTHDHPGPDSLSTHWDPPSPSYEKRIMSYSGY